MHSYIYTFHNIDFTVVYPMDTIQHTLYITYLFSGIIYLLCTIIIRYNNCSPCTAGKSACDSYCVQSWLK